MTMINLGKHAFNKSDIRSFSIRKISGKFDVLARTNIGEYLLSTHEYDYSAEYELKEYVEAYNFAEFEEPKTVTTPKGNVAFAFKIESNKWKTKSIICNQIVEIETYGIPLQSELKKLDELIDEVLMKV